MNRLDVIQSVCDVIDESVNNIELTTRLKRFIDKAYVECLRREYKEPPTIELTDNTELVNDIRNAPFMTYYTVWLHYLNEGDTAMAGIYKDEYEGFRFYKPASKPIKIIDVYDIGGCENE